MGKFHGNTLGPTGEIIENPDKTLGQDFGTPQALHNNARHNTGCNQERTGAEADGLAEDVEEED